MTSYSLRKDLRLHTQARAGANLDKRVSIDTSGELWGKLVVPSRRAVWRRVCRHLHDTLWDELRRDYTRYE